MKILTLDPGGTTGYCFMETYDDREAIKRFVSGQLGPQPHHADLWEWLVVYRPDIVISESFEYRNKARAGLVLVSKEYIGITKLWCNLYEKEYNEQSPASAMGFVQDQHIKNLSMWKTGNPHAMDAVRHMIYYCTNPNIDPSLSFVRDRFLRLGYRQEQSKLI